MRGGGRTGEVGEGPGSGGGEEVGISCPRDADCVLTSVGGERPVTGVDV